MTIRAELSLECVCGATWQETFVFDSVPEEGAATPVNLTGWNAVMTVDNAVDRVLEYSLATGHLAIDGPAGTVTLAVPAHTTLRYPNPGTMKYELRLIEPGGEVRSVLSGQIEVRETVRP